MQDKPIKCQNCGKQLARWTEDGGIASWPSEVMSSDRAIDDNHTEITFCCSDCGCKLSVRT